MLEKVSTILKMADESNTAVISFICTDYNMVYSVVTTAEKTNTPALPGRTAPQSAAMENRAHPQTRCKI